MDLNDYKKDGFIKKVEVLATDNSCDNYKLLNSKIFEIDEVIEKKILPCKQCTYQLNKNSKLGWCRCCYTPIIEQNI